MLPKLIPKFKGKMRKKTQKNFLVGGEFGKARPAWNNIPKM